MLQSLKLLLKTPDRSPIGDGPKHRDASDLEVRQGQRFTGDLTIGTLKMKLGAGPVWC